MDRADFRYLTREFAVTAAKKLGIETDFRGEHELRAEIKQRDPVTSQRLETFINSYWEWDDFHRRVEAQEKAGKLTSDERAQLDALILKRDQSREDLKKRFP